MRSPMTRRWATSLLFITAAGCGSSSPPAEQNISTSGVQQAGGGASGSAAGGSGGGASTGSGSGSPGGGSTSGVAPVTSGSQASGANGLDASTAGSSADANAPPGTSPTGNDASAGAQTQDAASGAEGGAEDAGPPAVRFVGRVDNTSATGPRFAWPGSTILARFTGSTIGVRLSGPTTYFDVSIDGKMQSTPLIISPATTSYPLATGLSSGPHELTVYRRNEAGIGGTGDTTFLGLILDPAGALLPPSLPSARRIEIVGDSITSGFGDESVGGACPNQLAAQDYDVAYGAVAARTLGADLITIAWTGKGMYRNSGGDTTNTMPILYGRTLPDETTGTWDFTSWIPDAVVIYLGNNDFGQGDPGQPYVTTYKAFIARVRMYYPNAFIVCTIGPNLMDPKLSEERTYVQGIVADETAAGDKNIDFLEMPQPTAAEGTGCGGHPLAVTHARMGAALVTELQTKLGW